MRQPIALGLTYCLSLGKHTPRGSRKDVTRARWTGFLVGLSLFEKHTTHSISHPVVGTICLSYNHGKTAVYPLIPPSHDSSLVITTRSQWHVINQRYILLCIWRYVPRYWTTMRTRQPHFLFSPWATISFDELSQARPHIHTQLRYRLACVCVLVRSPRRCKNLFRCTVTL